MSKTEDNTTEKIELTETGSQHKETFSESKSKEKSVTFCEENANYDGNGQHETSQ